MSLARLPLLSWGEQPSPLWLLPLLTMFSILGATLLLAQKFADDESLAKQIDFSISAAQVTVQTRQMAARQERFLFGVRTHFSTRRSFPPTAATWHAYWRALAHGGLPPEVSDVLFVHARRAERAASSARRLAFSRRGAQAGAAVDFNGQEEAFARARDCDCAVASGRLAGANTDTAVIALLLPAYAPGLANGDVTQRRRALRGYFIAFYPVATLMQTVMLRHDPDRGLQVLDLGPTGQARLLTPTLLDEQRPSGAPAKERDAQEHEIEIGGRAWVLRFLDLQLHDPLHWPPSRIVRHGGLLLSLLGAALVFALTSQRLQATAIARRINYELQLSEQRFQLAARGTREGLWERDFLQEHCYFSDQLCTLLGYSPEHFDDAGEFLFPYVSEEDIGRLRAALQDHLDSRAPLDLELRMRTQSGRIGWFRLCGQAQFDGTGRPLRLAGSLSDITARKANETELAEHREHLRQLVDARTQELQQALALANAASQAKSDFLANMSHELRTPLHAVLSFAALGIERATSAGQDKLRHYCERIKQSSERLLNLVNDLLDLAKLESGHLQLDMQIVALAPLIEEMRDEFVPLLDAKRLRLVLRDAIFDSHVKCDPKRIQQVLANLLANAIRFSREDSMIAITLSEALLPRGRRGSDGRWQPAIEISVADEGIGIPELELDAVFDKFVQSTRSRTGAGGTGLGLAICREIVLAHRGRIKATNRPAGGALFTVILPLDMVPSDHLLPAPETKE
jgi:PAS domain S-box-containing protein